MSPEDLTRSIEDFLSEAPDSVVVEDGQVVFDLALAHCSITLERDKCVLQLWSDERNAVRRVLASEVKNGVLRLSVRKFGESKPHRLEICRGGDRRTPTAKKAARAAYQRKLQRVLLRSFPDFVLEKSRLSSAVDLQHSFGPAYARGLLRKGQSAFAVLGVSAEETSATVDAALAIGLLWLDHCREQNATRFAVRGLKLFLPSGRSETVRARGADIHSATGLHIYELEERDEVVAEFDATDSGNIATRLVHCPDPAAARERFAAAIRRIHALVPMTDVVVTSSTEISFRIHGLEFARAKTGLASGSFEQEQQISFGTGSFETQLTAQNEPQFTELMKRVAATRRAGGNHHDPLWRMHPERWLESVVLADVSALDSELDSSQVYSQVPAFAASDRAMIDVLVCTRRGRLAVIELKADEDLQLPMQGLDYWARVHFHNQRGEFQKFGYFPGKHISTDPPLLYLVAPALRVHPSTDTLLKFLSPKIEWTLLGVDEKWREGVRVIFRKNKTLNHKGHEGH